MHRRYEDRLGLKPHENIGIRSWKCIHDMGVFWQLFVCSFGDVHFEQSLKIWDCIILASFLLCFQVSSFLNTRNSKRYLLWWTLYGQLRCTLGFSFFNWDLPLVSIYFSQIILYGMHGSSDWWYIFYEYLSLCNDTRMLQLLGTVKLHARTSRIPVFANCCGGKIQKRRWWIDCGLLICM